jgi:hypothetical protein
VHNQAKTKTKDYALIKSAMEIAFSNSEIGEKRNQRQTKSE